MNTPGRGTNNKMHSNAQSITHDLDRGHRGHQGPPKTGYISNTATVEMNGVLLNHHQGNGSLAKPFSNSNDVNGNKPQPTEPTASVNGTAHNTASNSPNVKVNLVSRLSEHQSLVQSSQHDSSISTVGSHDVTSSQRHGDGHRSSSYHSPSTRSVPPVRRREMSTQRHNVRRNNTVSGVTREATQVLQSYMQCRSSSLIDSSHNSSFRSHPSDTVKHSMTRRVPFSPINEHDLAERLCIGEADIEGFGITTSDDASSTFNSLEMRNEGSSRANTLDSSVGRNTRNTGNFGGSEVSGTSEDLKGVLANMPSSHHKRKPSVGLSTLADNSTCGSLTSSDDDAASVPSSSIDNQQRKKPVMQRFKERLRASFRRKKSRPAASSDVESMRESNASATHLAIPDSQSSGKNGKWGKSSNKKTSAKSMRTDSSTGASRPASSSTTGSNVVMHDAVSDTGTQSSSVSRSRSDAVDTTRDMKEKEVSGVLSKIRRSVRSTRRRSGDKPSNKQDQKPSGDQILTNQDVDDARAEFREPYPPPLPSGIDRAGFRSQHPRAHAAESTLKPSRLFSRTSDISIDGNDEVDSPPGPLPDSDSAQRHRLQHQTSKNFGDKSSEEKKEMYEAIASRLLDISDDVMKSSPALAADCQLAFAMEIERPVRTANTTASPIISSSDHGTLLQQLAASVSYESFSQLISQTISNSDDLVAQQIAMLFRLTTDAINIAGGPGRSVAARLTQMSMQYFQQMYAPRLVEAGGWESLVEEDLSGTEVD